MQGEQTRSGLNFAPHPGLFRHHAGGDYLDQIKFAADAGFTAWEDSGMMGRPIALQEKAASIMASRGMMMGNFLGYASYTQSSFTDPTSHSRRVLRQRLTAIVECAKRVNARWVTVVPGTDSGRFSFKQETAKVVESLKGCSDILAAEEIVMTLKVERRVPSRPRGFLTSVPQAYRICRVVGSPSCKLLVDLSEPQISADNLESAWSEVASLQCASEVIAEGERSQEILEFLYKNDFQGVIGMEHAGSQQDREEESALLQSYRKVDNFNS